MCTLFKVWNNSTKMLNQSFFEPSSHLVFFFLLNLFILVQSGFLLGGVYVLEGVDMIKRGEGGGGGG